MVLSIMHLMKLKFSYAHDRLYDLNLYYDYTVVIQCFAIVIPRRRYFC